MYPEFIAIYIGLIIIIALLVVILVLQLKNKSNSGVGYTKSYTSNFNKSEHAPSQTLSGNIVFCKNCAAEFDVSQRACPRCGTPR